MLRSSWRIPFYTRKSILPPRLHISRRHHIHPSYQSIHPHLPWKSERFPSGANMQIYCNQGSCLHKKRVRLLQDWLGHKHGGGFLVWGQKYGCRDSLSKNSQNVTVVTNVFEANWRDLWDRQWHIRCEAVSSLLCFDLIVFFFSARKTRVTLSCETAAFLMNQFPFFKFVPGYFIFYTIGSTYWCLAFQTLFLAADCR